MITITIFFKCQGVYVFYILSVPNLIHYYDATSNRRDAPGITSSIMSAMVPIYINPHTEFNQQDFLDFLMKRNAWAKCVYAFDVLALMQHMVLA